MTNEQIKQIQQTQKQAVAQAALSYVKAGMILGVGTGSTVNCLIDLLPQVNLKGAVSSSEQTAQRLQKLGIEVMDLNFTGNLDLYIDGADEVNAHLQLIKGGGGALTREKIVAAASSQFICLVDESKWVTQLGKAFPLPVEVLPMARSYVARELAHLGGDPVYRSGFVTDNGNLILDVHHLNITDALALEQQINNIAGVVCNGIFAQQAAHKLLIARETGVEELSC